MPVARETRATHFGGTLSQRETACGVISSAAPKAVMLPAALIAAIRPASRLRFSLMLLV